jgi:hypothetical protein
MPHHIVVALNIAALPCAAFVVYRAAKRSLRL